MTKDKITTKQCLLDSLCSLVNEPSKRKEPSDQSTKKPRSVDRNGAKETDNEFKQDNLVLTNDHVNNFNITACK